MTPEPIRIEKFPDSQVCQEIHVYETLASTNDTALSLGQDGIAILALNQTAGRGQHGRTWTSKPNASMLLSISWRPPEELRQPAKIIAVTSLALLWSVYGLTNTVPRLKWPNDILVGGRKICGILVEQTSNSPTIIGIGLNLNQTTDDFHEAGLPDATSLFMETERVFDPAAMAFLVLATLDGVLKDGGVDNLEQSWANSLELLNKRVVITRHDDTTLTGILLKVSFAEMELLCDDGVQQTLPPEAIRHMNEA